MIRQPAARLSSLPSNSLGPFPPIRPGPNSPTSPSSYAVSSSVGEKLVTLGRDDGAWKVDGDKPGGILQGCIFSSYGGDSH